MRSIGSDLHMDYSAVGPTTHLAARMEQMATPGTILITAADAAAGRGLRAGQAASGPMAVKGLAHPVDVYEVIGAGTVRSRLQAAAARGSPGSSGRDVELEQLARPLERAAAGHGQVVARRRRARRRQVAPLLRVHALRIAPRAGCSWRPARCPTARPRRYLPVIDLLKSYFQIEAGTTRARSARR